jgi:hypothetical protein
MRAHNSFYVCPGGAEACGVQNASGAITCGRGLSGVLCAVCKDGYKTGSNGLCTPCSK